ncbi:MAG TPA: hypothetical protein VF885_13510 [Arthrobacter sp.]
MEELIGHSLASLVGPGYDYGHATRSTVRDKVIHAARLARRSRLTRGRYDFALRWLKTGSQHVTLFKLGRYEARIADGLARLESGAVMIVEPSPDFVETVERTILTRFDDAMIAPLGMAGAAFAGAMLRRRGDHPDRTDVLVAIQEARITTLAPGRRQDIIALLESADKDLAGYRLEHHEEAILEALFLLDPARTA